jgi:hypothetical protein
MWWIAFALAADLGDASKSLRAAEDACDTDEMQAQLEPRAVGRERVVPEVACACVGSRGLLRGHPRRP